MFNEIERQALKTKHKLNKYFNKKKLCTSIQLTNAKIKRNTSPTKTTCKINKRNASTLREKHYSKF